MAEAGTTEFSIATVAGDTGVERDEACARVGFLPSRPHHLGDGRRPFDVPCIARNSWPLRR